MIICCACRGNLNWHMQSWSQATEFICHKAIWCSCEKTYIHIIISQQSSTYTSNWNKKQKNKLNLEKKNKNQDKEKSFLIFMLLSLCFTDCAWLELFIHDYRRAINLSFKEWKEFPCLNLHHLVHTIKVYHSYIINRLAFFCMWN